MWSFYESQLERFEYITDAKAIQRDPNAPGSEERYIERILRVDVS